MGKQGGKPAKTGVKTRVFKYTTPDHSDDEEADDQQNVPRQTPRPVDADEERTQADGEGSTSQNTIETTVAKILNEALPQALANALPGMAELLKSMMGEKPNGGTSKPDESDDDESSEDDEEDEDGAAAAAQRNEEAKMPIENENEAEESRQVLERAQSLLGAGGPGVGDLGTRAVAPAAISPLGARLPSRSDRGNPKRANKFPILYDVV